MQVKAAKNFANSPNGIKVDQVKKGDIIDVDESAVAGMVDAEQIESPKGKDYAKELEKSLNTKGDGDKSVNKMNKAELVAYATDVLEVEIDESLNKADFLAAVNEAITDAEDNE